MNRYILPAISVVGGLTALNGNPANASIWELQVDAAPTGQAQYFGTQETCQRPDGSIRPESLCTGYSQTETHPVLFTFWFDTDKGPTQTAFALVDPPGGWRYYAFEGEITFTGDAFLGLNGRSGMDTGSAPVTLPQFPGITATGLFMGTASNYAVTYRRTIEGTAPVPEPATWAMLIAGFGLLGSLLRDRPANRSRMA